MSVHDFREWIPEFEAWINLACVYRDRACGGIRALHIAFSEWCMRNRSVPCTRYVFEQLLADQGFHVCDLVVDSLLLKVDAPRTHSHDAAESAPFAPAVSLQKPLRSTPRSEVSQ
jgi:hypothetical protein